MADAYRAAAFARTRADADRVAEAIRRAGGAVIAADAEALPPALADHYLRLKRAGRL